MIMSYYVLLKWRNQNFQIDKFLHKFYTLHHSQPELSRIWTEAEPDMSMFYDTIEITHIMCV